MCETCGCMLKPPNPQAIPENSIFSPNASEQNPHQHQLLHSIMSRNDKQARANREWLNKHAIFCVNVMSSPGSGKTRLLESTIASLKPDFNIAVIEGDLETENDANRIRAQGVPAIQITTGSACHLDAHYIHDALHQLDLHAIDIIFIENVGNLVCPAAFDLGQHANIVLLSTTEGDDKPLKYPVMFQKVDGLIISKIELLAFFDDFSVVTAQQNFSRLANKNPVWPLSAKTQEGMAPWLDWLRAHIPQSKRAHRTKELTE